MLIFNDPYENEMHKNQHLKKAYGGHWHPPPQRNLCTLVKMMTILDDALGRKEILNTKNNEFNSAAIFQLWHDPPMLCRGQINVADIRYR